MGSIDRTSKLLPINVSSNIALCTEIELSPYAGAMVLIPAGLTLTTLAVHVAEKKGGTYLPLYDASGAVLVNGAVALLHTRSYMLPIAAFAAASVKLVSNQAAVEAIFVTPKG